jgi:hypothetical protein
MLGLILLELTEELCLKVLSSFIGSCRDIYCSKLLVLWLFVFLDASSTACLE